PKSNPYQKVGLFRRTPSGRERCGRRSKLRLYSSMHERRNPQYITGLNFAIRTALSVRQQTENYQMSIRSHVDLTVGHDWRGQAGGRANSIAAGALGAAVY